MRSAFAPSLTTAVGALAVVALALASLMAGRPAARPNLLLITLDTVRADHCSTYGYRFRTTPTLEEVERDGVLVEDAYAPMATTTPSHASLFTGLLPRAHGLLANGDVLVPERVTLAERLGAAGYQTAAFVSSYVLDHRFGLDQGFAEYDDRMDGRPPPGPRGSNRPRGPRRAHRGLVEQNGRVTTDEAVAWLHERRDPRRPFFLWVHYFDAHDPYRPLARYSLLFASDDDSDLARETASYDREIRGVNDVVGRLLRVLRDEGLESSTLVVIAGDHGEGLMQHGWMHHGLQLYEELLHVPLLLRWPGRLPAGLRLQGPVELTDVLPTVLDLLDVRMRPDEPGLPGTSLVAAMRAGAALAPERALFFQRRTYPAGSVGGGLTVRGEQLAVRVGRWKYIEAPEERTAELYDLARDPGERVNLVTSHPEEAAALAHRLAAWRRATVAAPSTSAWLSTEDVARLRSLGYVP